MHTNRETFGRFRGALRVLVGLSLLVAILLGLVYLFTMTADPVRTRHVGAKPRSAHQNLKSKQHRLLEQQLEAQFKEQARAEKEAIAKRESLKIRGKNKIASSDLSKASSKLTHKISRAKKLLRKEIAAETSRQRTTDKHGVHSGKGVTSGIPAINPADPDFDAETAMDMSGSAMDLNEDEPMSVADQTRKNRKVSRRGNGLDFGLTDQFFRELDGLDDPTL